MSFLSSIANTTVNFLRDAMPTVINEVIHQAWQDPCLGKIVGGIGITFGGVCFVAASGMPKKVRSWIKKENTVQEPVSKVAGRVAMAGLGLACIGYGIYNIALGLHEFLNPFINCPPQHRRELEVAIKKINDCPQGKTLMEDVQKDGRFSIQCSKSVSRGWVHLGTRTIVLDPNEGEAEIIETLIGELANLNRAKEFSKLGDEVCSFTRNDFAIKKERIEFGSNRDLAKIIEKCFPHHLMIHPLQISSFDYYLAIQERGGHTEGYREQWDQACGKKE